MSSLINTALGRVSLATSRRPLWVRLANAMALHRSRARLGALDARLLDDIGLDRSTAEAEANRPVWDAPASWMK
ncbi:MAG: DUF1127 domain-containing protein [Rhodobacteraceae bacterium]|nr:DUF1127 domain-containing protein [Paracoccaceae bacterium]